MAKFNTKGIESGKTENVAGGISYERKDFRQEIAAQVLTALLAGKDRFYETEHSLIDRLRTLFKQACENGYAKFLAKAMIYARVKGNLRSITHLIAVALAEHAPRGDGYLRKAFNSSVQRPDDMIEVVALWDFQHPHKKEQNKGSMVPNVLRKAYRDVLESKKFNEFSLKRYSGNGKIKLSDIVKLCRPRPKKREDETLFKRLLNNELNDVETMETLRSTGEESETKTKEAFSKLLNEGKLGYMAALKNIRNALQEGLSNEDIDKWCALISDPDKVKKSKVFPFRFYIAWKELREVKIDQFVLSKIENALESAITSSATNLELVGDNEKVAVVVDDSGSMGNDLKESITLFETGMVLGGMLLKALPKGSARVYRFGTSVRDVTEDFESSVLRFVSRSKPESGATYVHLPFEILTKTNTKVDKIIIITDLQLYSLNSSWGNHISNDELSKYFNKYRKTISPNAKLLFWTLCAYSGGTPIKLNGDIMEVAGFSDQLIPLIPKFWNNQNALVDEIEAITL